MYTVNTVNMYFNSKHSAHTDAKKPERLKNKQLEGDAVMSGKGLSILCLQCLHVYMA